ncbi:hypothetical protein ALP29_200165 [Pseudomonas syringae pv. avii]|uniref:Uncharacterized protein n=1 Tax=Pseudomonas syringae pv. avii TaxID=663959 RepID=A0A3M5UIA9_PSESX|nr:hypothetical protein ALP29_200165 [Pseudomonas syringae pv. avii]
MQLLGNVPAFATVFDHGDDAAQVAVCTLEAFDNRLVGLVRVVMQMFVLTHCLSLLCDRFRLALYPPRGDRSNVLPMVLSTMISTVAGECHARGRMRRSPGYQ